MYANLVWNFKEIDVTFIQNGSIQIVHFSNTFPISMKSFLFSCILFVIQFTLNAQEKEVRIAGNISLDEVLFPECLSISLLQQEDTIWHEKKLWLGNFLFNGCLKSNENYELVISGKYVKPISIELQKNSDSLLWDEYLFPNIKMIELLYDKFDNSAYFDFNETVHFENFDLEFFQRTLRKYPTLKIEFQQAIHPNESVKVAKRRMKTFKKHLLQNGIHANRFSFSTEIQPVDTSKTTETRARIFYSVKSI